MMLIVFVFKITREIKCAILQTVTIRKKKVHDINGDMFLAIGRCLHNVLLSERF